MRELGTFPCACGGTVSLAEEIGTGDAVALHSEPHCPWFERASSKDIAEAWNKEQERKGSG